MAFYHFKKRARPPGFEMSIFKCLFPYISQKAYPSPPNISVLVFVSALLGTPLIYFAFYEKISPQSGVILLVNMIFFASGGKIPFILLVEFGRNRVMHHFTGSTLEAKIQYIILLKHHFTGSFLKKIACGAHHFTGASFL